MKKTKVLYMLGWWITGGIENYLLNVIDHIDRDKYEIDVVLLKSGTYGAEQVLVDRGCRVLYYSADTIRGQISEIRKLLRAGNYDLIHIMQGYLAPEPPVVFSFACLFDRKRLGYKIINHSHGTEDLTRKPPPIVTLARNLYRFALKLMLNQADAFAACSPEAGAFMYGKKQKVQVLYNGINLERFQNAALSHNHDEWRNKYHISDTNKNFVIVARIADEKNPFFLVEVIQKLKFYVPNIMLTWVGDGSLRKELENQIQQKGLSSNFNLLGVQEHVEEILACCDYFILPSKREGAPLTLIEAQASGLKCFTSDRVPGIIDCGGVSFLALEESAEYWATKIAEIIHTEKHADIDTVLLRRFDINETAIALSSFYDTLI